MIKVLVVDDSVVARKMLTTELMRDDGLDVIGAVDPYDARDKILRFHPDVITLDIEMPRMDGLSFLARLMAYHPVPVVIVSSLTPRNSEVALRALELGAFEVIAKPATPRAMAELSNQLLRAIRTAATANVSRLVRNARYAEMPATARPALGRLRGGTSRRVIAIGASTGGPVALEQLLSALPANTPGVLIVQHMPAGFTAAFARRLNDRCALSVKEAEDGDVVTPGVALVAPGGRHLVLQRGDIGVFVGVRDGPPVHYQRPAVDVLFHSVAQIARAEAVGVLLTGMGADGASGMRVMRDAGAHTIAQDEATCVVFSMPKEAIRFGGACEVLPLSRIAAAVVNAVSTDVLPAARRQSRA